MRLLKEDLDITDMYEYVDDKLRKDALNLCHELTEFIDNYIEILEDDFANRIQDLNNDITFTITSDEWNENKIDPVAMELYNRIKE